MTKLELINKEIEDVKDYFRDRKKYNLQSKLYTFERLKLLEQIKTILEAWEIAKEKNVRITTVKSSPSFEVYDSLFNQDTIGKYQLNECDYEKIKKALEVK